MGVLLRGNSTSRCYSKQRDHPLNIWTKLGIWAEKAYFLRSGALCLTIGGGAEVAKSYTPSTPIPTVELANFYLLY
jgi:hypothetical protein